VCDLRRHVRLYRKDSGVPSRGEFLLAARAPIVIWAFGREREARFEKDARIPLDDKDR
jgi:hypothetical protein